MLCYLIALFGTGSFDLFNVYFGTDFSTWKVPSFLILAPVLSPVKYFLLWEDFHDLSVMLAVNSSTAFWAGLVMVHAVVPGNCNKWYPHLGPWTSETKHSILRSSIVSGRHQRNIAIHLLFHPIPGHSGRGRNRTQSRSCCLGTRKSSDCNGARENLLLWLWLLLKWDHHYIVFVNIHGGNYMTKRVNFSLCN